MRQSVSGWVLLVFNVQQDNSLSRSGNNFGLQVIQAESVIPILPKTETEIDA